MSENRPESEKFESKSVNKDIIPLLKGWDYEPGTINVRKIAGIDGKPKLQMRLDLGLLQMEVTGRPDGHRPHGHESLLEYYESQLQDHRHENGSEIGFHLTGTDCQLLREEAHMYYQRYLSLFVLEDFKGVVRDTARNLRVLDLCGKFANSERDRLVLEQYRPYSTMMNVRARAQMFVKERKYELAVESVREGLKEIREFFDRFGQDEAYEHSNEVRVLKKLAREIRRKLPIDPMQKLRTQLDRAVKKENYEEAAKLRDEIKRKTERVE